MFEGDVNFWIWMKRCTIIWHLSEINIILISKTQMQSLLKKLSVLTWKKIV